MKRVWLLSVLLVCSLVQAEERVDLQDLQIEHITNGWGESARGRSIAGKPLSVGGQAFANGVGTHAPSRTRVLLHGEGLRFQAQVGVDDHATGAVEFQVTVDDKMVWQSGVMKKGDAPKSVDLSLKGAKSMELLVTDGGNGIGSDHANWCNAHFTYRKTAPQLVRFSPWVPLNSPAEMAGARAALIPFPVEVRWKRGDLKLQSLVVATAQPESAQSALAALKRFNNQGEFKVTAGNKPNLLFKLQSLKSSTHPEAYELNVSAQGIVITANKPAGLFYGVQTLRQLIQPDGSALKVPFCSIVDYPAFGIRGFMHDVGRNFISIEELKKQIDIMAQYKLNVFHFHPTENEGYRVESKRYPKLNTPEAMTRWPGKFYTTAQLKELVAYCRDRHMEILPELDMPGHSAYFDRVFGFGMQSDQGVAVLKELVDEWLEIFDAPWFHLGTDEVQMTRPTFVTEMTEYLRNKGKKTISWHHGLHPYDGKTIHQCWNAGREKNPIIDSVGYVNTDDPVIQARNYFFRQYCHVPKEDERNLGGILCYWPDEPVVNEDVEMRIAAVYPSILAFSERIWKGNRSDWPVMPNEVSYHGAPALGSGRHLAFLDFEQRLLTHRDRYFRKFRPDHFPYVANGIMPWQTIGPFPNGGETEKVFEPEKVLKASYELDGKKYQWQTNWGGTVSLQDVYGKSKEKQTAYALTWVFSPKAMEVEAWINFSRKYLAWPQPENPKQGHWACAGSRIWVNDSEIKPPIWEKPDRYRAPVTEESCIFREPSKIKLKKGWNKVMMKATNQFEPWTVTFLPIKREGKGFTEVPGLKFSIQPK